MRTHTLLAVLMGLVLPLWGCTVLPTPSGHNDDDDDSSPDDDTTGGDDDATFDDDDATADDDDATADDDDATADDDTSPPLPDADGDSIADADEGGGDTDGDGIPDMMDTDSDDDGILDSIEAGDGDTNTAPADSDGDGTPDFRDDDSDGDGIADAAEGGGDLDGDGDGNFRDDDADGDGIPDEVELAFDHDGDGLGDYKDEDSDGDGVDDSVEGDSDPDEDGQPSYLDDDADGDGLLDEDEGDSDPDNDGVPSFLDDDSDDDTIPDEFDPGPQDRDADGDGFADAAEVSVGANPGSAASQPGEAWTYAEIEAGDSQSFAIAGVTPDSSGVDLVFVYDTTGSGAAYVVNTIAAIDAISEGVAVERPGSGFALATHADYYFLDFGSFGDLPFVLEQQLTTDRATFLDAVEALGSAGGNDTEDASYEGLFQAVTGRGFDQDCDGVHDSSTDVRPFIASPTDAFGGDVTSAYDASVEGTGSRGGVGLRDGPTPVFVWMTDGTARDPDAGSEAPESCSEPAGHEAVIDAINAVNGRVVGIELDTAITFLPDVELVTEATGSWVDLDGDGATDDLPAIAGTSAGDIDDAVDSVLQMTEGGGADSYDVTVAAVAGDTDMLDSVSPASRNDLAPGTNASFTVTVTIPSSWANELDQVYTLQLNIVANGSYVMETYNLLIVVPGT